MLAFVEINGTVNHAFTYLKNHKKYSFLNSIFVK